MKIVQESDQPASSFHYLATCPALFSFTSISKVVHNRIDFSHIEIPVVTIAVDDEIQVGTPKLPLIVTLK